MTKRTRKTTTLGHQKPTAPEDRSPVNNRNRHFAAVALLALSGLLVYANGLSNGFVHDDNYQIVRNPFLQPDEPLHRLFTTDVWGYTSPGRGGISNYYRPLQMLSYRWTTCLAGLDPRSFHTVNLVFHILTTFAGYAVFWQLTQKYWLSVSAALLLALHPIHTEAVIWIAALPELGCALFLFLSFLLFLFVRRDLTFAPKERREPNKGRAAKKKRDLKTGSRSFTWNTRVLWLASLLCFAVALLWKEMALTLPLLIAAYIFMVPQENSTLVSRLWKAARASLPYWAVVAAYLVLRYQVLGFVSRDQRSWVLSPMEYVLSVIHLVGKYWLKLLLPVHLNAFYAFEPVHSLGEPRVLASMVFVVLASGMIFYGLRRAPLASFLASWVFLTLLPVLHLRGVGTNVFTERYLYIPSLGFCLLVSWLASQGLGLLPRQRRPGIAVTALALVAILYGAQTLRRNSDWKNDFIFYSKAAAASPQSASMRNSLAHVLRAEKGDLDEAERQSLLAIALAKEERPPDQGQIATAYLNLANIYIQRQQYPKALETAQSGLAIQTFPGLRVAQGVALMYLGRLEEAHRILLEVNRNLPHDELVLHYLGVIALSQKQLEPAIDYFQKALKVLPDYADAHNNLGAAYVELGRFDQALPHFQRAAALSPNNPMVYTNLASILANLGRLSEARSQLQRALALSPNYTPAQTQLAALDRLERQPR